MGLKNSSVATLSIDLEMDTSEAAASLVRFGGVADKATQEAIRVLQRLERESAGMVDVSGAITRLQSLSAAANDTSAETSRSLARIESSGERMIAQLERGLPYIGKSAAEVRALKVETLALAAESKGMLDVATRLRAVGAATAEAERDMGKLGSGMRGGAGSAAQLSFQLNDVFVGLASGQKPMTVFIQQGAQIVQLAQMAEGGVKGFATEIGSLALRFTPLIAATAVAGVALYRWKDALDDAAGIKKFVDGLGLTHKELKKLKEQAVTTSDVIAGVWKTINEGTGATGTGKSVMDSLFHADDLKQVQTFVSQIYGVFVGGYNAIVETWGQISGAVSGFVAKAAAAAAAFFKPLIDAAQWAASGISSIFSAIYEWVADRVRAMGAAVAPILQAIGLEKAASAMASVGSSLGKTFGGAYSKATQQFVTSTNAFVAKSAENAIAAAQDRLTKKANEIKADRTPKVDRHAEQLAREAEAIEAQIRNLYKLADAYDVSGAAALIAEARVKAESAAIKNRGDIEAAVERQVRLAIAQRVSDAAKSTVAMVQQADAQRRVNEMVAAGLAPASRAAEMVKDQIADLPLLAAIQVAQQKGMAAEVAKATEALDRQRAARAALNAENRVAEDLKLTEQIKRQTELSQQASAATAELGERRLKALRGLSGQSLQDELAAINAEQEKSNILLRAQAEAADLVAKGMTNAAAATLSQADAAARAVDAGAAQRKAEEKIQRQKEQFLDAAQQFADIVGGGLGRAISGIMPLLDKAASVFATGSTLGRLAAGAGIGGVVASATGGNGLTGAAGGALGGLAGKEAASALAKSGISSILGPGLEKALGSALPVVGSIAGSLLSSVVGGLFTKVKKASATVEIMAGEAMMTSVVGNSGKLKAVAGSMADGLIGGLTGIADQLGGILGDNLRVSIGQRNKTFRVDLSGMGRTKNMPKFDTQEEAVAYAVQSLIQQGAITGLRAGTDALLRGKGDLQAQLQKALSFEGVFDELKQRTDPVGYAMDAIAKEFDALNKVFKEAGASADDYAKLQQLRTLKEQEAQQQAEKAVQDTSERLGLERQLLEAQGDTAAIRALDLAALQEGNRALQMQIWAVQDKAEADRAAAEAAQAAAEAEAALTSARLGLEGQILQLTGNTTEIRARELAALDASLRPLQQRIYDLQDEAAATAVAAQAEQELAAKRAAFAQERSGLMTQIFQLEGNTAALRFQELQALDPANRALQEYIYKLQDQAAATDKAAQAAADAASKQEAIANERNGLMQQLWQLTGNTAAIRKAQLASLDPANRALQKQVWAIEDAQAAAKAADELRQAWQSVGDTLMDEVSRIRGLSETAAGGSFASLQGRFNASTLAARAGDQDAAKLLPELSRSLLDAATQQATSRQELARIQAQTAASLEATYALITKATGASSMATASMLPTVPGASSPALTAQAWWSTFASNAPAMRPASANDDTASEVRALRLEVVRLREQNNEGNAQIAGPVARMDRRLDAVTSESGGNAIAVEQAA